MRIKLKDKIGNKKTEHKEGKRTSAAYPHTAMTRSLSHMYEEHKLRQVKKGVQLVSRWWGEK